MQRHQHQVYENTFESVGSGTVMSVHIDKTKMLVITNLHVIQKIMIKLGQPLPEDDNNIDAYNTFLSKRLVFVATENNLPENNLPYGSTVDASAKRAFRNPSCASGAPSSELRARARTWAQPCS